MARHAEPPNRRHSLLRAPRNARQPLIREVHQADRSLWLGSLSRLDIRFRPESRHPCEGRIQRDPVRPPRTGRGRADRSRWSRLAARPPRNACGWPRCASAPPSRLRSNAVSGPRLSSSCKHWRCRCKAPLALVGRSMLAPVGGQPASYFAASTATNGRPEQRFDEISGRGCPSSFGLHSEKSRP
jgi:hypothetical protein